MTNWRTTKILKFWRFQRFVRWMMLFLYPEYVYMKNLQMLKNFMLLWLYGGWLRPKPTEVVSPAPPSAKNIGSFVHPFEFVVSVDRSTPSHDKVTLHVITRSQKLMNNKFSSNFCFFRDFKVSTVQKIQFNQNLIV